MKVVFDGRSLLPHIEKIRELAILVRASSALDYGCGKAALYAKQNFDTSNGIRISSLSEYWNLKEIYLYDPAVAQFSTRPSSKSDIVICTDVLEHIDEGDIPYVLDDIFALSNRMVFANVASYPAAKTLPNGENAHATIRPPEWWRSEIERAAASSAVAYHVGIRERDTASGGFKDYTMTRGIAA